MTPIEFAEVVEAFCKRPAMYTWRGTFAEVIACLEGYAKGMGVEPGYHYSWNPFCKWLAVQWDYSDKGFPLPWQLFLDKYSDENAALQALSQLYCEYAESKANLR
jgi:hypothetical protein